MTTVVTQRHLEILLKEVGPTLLVELPSKIKQANFVHIKIYLQLKVIPLVILTKLIFIFCIYVPPHLRPL